MKRSLRPAVVTLILACASWSASYAGEQRIFESKEVETVSIEEPWQFTLALPGWMPGVFGTAGVRGRSSHVDVHFDELLRHTDFVAALAGEARKGRFGVMGGFLYLSASDGLSSNGLISKLDFRVDQYIAEAALSWRVVDKPRGWLDVVAGTRYINLYQRLTISPDGRAIDRASERLVDTVSERITDRLLARLSRSRFRDLERSEIAEELDRGLRDLRGRNPPLPEAPLGARIPAEVRDAIGHLIENRTQGIRAEVARLAGLSPAERAAEIGRRVAASRRDLEDRISDFLGRKLDRVVSKENDWFDPFIGLRGRFDLTPAFYLTAAGDVGGFGVGSDLTWQAYGAVGCHLSRSVFAEAGYRWLYIDYRRGGLIYDVDIRGFQVTVGIQF